MRSYIFIFFYSLLASGQNNPNAYKQSVGATQTFVAEDGEFYIDSIKVDISKVYLDPENIKEVRKFKSGSSEIFSSNNGATLISRKNKNRLVPLNEIIASVKKDIKYANTKIEVVINGNMIKSYYDYFFEESAIVNLAILSPDKEGVNRDPAKTTIIITTKHSNP